MTAILFALIFAAPPTVVAEQARWSTDGRTIVTEQLVRQADGDVRLVRRPGGCVDGICATVFALGASDEHAAVQTHSDRAVPLRWRERLIELTPDAGGLSDLPADNEHTALARAVQAWRNGIGGCSDLTLTVAAPTSVRAGYDDVHAVIWREDTWCSADDACYDPAAVAITTVYYIDEPDSRDDGRILDADVELNAIHFAWGSGAEGCGADADNTLAHELGHVMGLDHVCGDTSAPADLAGNPVPACTTDAPPVLLHATMYPYQACGETLKATPERIDVDGVCAIYPFEASTQPGCGYTATACCTIAPGGDGTPLIAPIALALLALVTRTRRAATRRRATAPR